MIVASHEMLFVRDVTTHVVFLDAGRILEEGEPHALFRNPKSERLRGFLGRVTDIIGDITAR